MFLIPLVAGGLLTLMAFSILTDPSIEGLEARLIRKPLHYLLLLSTGLLGITFAAAHMCIKLGILI